MKPPICEVTDEPFEPENGRRVRFLPASTDPKATATADHVVGLTPDEGWFSKAYADEAEALAATHTLAEAVSQLRAQRSRDGWERRKASQVRHEISGPVAVDRVVDAIRGWLPPALAELGLDEAEATLTRDQATVPGPEWRESATTTTFTTTETWASADHRVTYRFEDTRWDGPGGQPGMGDRFQGLVSLKVDDLWLFAPFSPASMVERFDVSGDRAPTVGAMLDELIDQLMLLQPTAD